MSENVCPSCGGTELEEDSAHGVVVRCRGHASLYILLTRASYSPSGVRALWFDGGVSVNSGTRALPDADIDCAAPTITGTVQAADSRIVSTMIV